MAWTGFKISLKIIEEGISDEAVKLLAGNAKPPPARLPLFLSGELQKPRNHHKPPPWESNHAAGPDLNKDMPMNWHWTPFLTIISIPYFYNPTTMQLCPKEVNGFSGTRSAPLTSYSWTNSSSRSSGCWPNDGWREVSSWTTPRQLWEASSTPFISGLAMLTSSLIGLNRE